MSGDWNNPLNWRVESPFSSFEILVFPANAIRRITTNDNSWTISSLRFEGSGFQIHGDELGIREEISAGPASTLNVIYCGIEPSLTCLIQAHTNMNTTNWLTLGIAPADGAGLFQFFDLHAPQHLRRFYRAVSP